MLILGAGPAGVATAVCLRALNVPFTLLERGAAVAAGLRRIDPETQILSPARLSLMPGMPRASQGEPQTNPTYLAFGEYVRRMEALCRTHQIAVRTGAEVRAVQRTGDGFRVELAGGEPLFGSHVVNATGMTAYPRLPEAFDAARTSLRWVHSLDVRAPELARCQRLLVVGGGQSAAEVLELWLSTRAAGARAWLSIRSPLRAVPRRPLGVDLHYWVWPFEFLPGRWLGIDPVRFRDPMVGGAVAAALRQGTITQLGKIQSYEAEGVVMESGEALQPDLLVFATGFEYALGHLEGLLEQDSRGWPRTRGCESTRTPGLYLLGLRQSCTQASGYLRGIARDARRVARRIAG